MEGDKLYRRFEALESQRKNLDNVLQEVERYVVPFRGEFYRPLTSEHEVKFRRREVWSSVPINACQLLASHMHGSLTSPSVKWFGIRFRADDLNQNNSAAEWLEDCENRMWQVLTESDFNSEAPEVYLDLASMGTSVFMMEPKKDAPEWDGLDFTALPVADTYFELDAHQHPMKVFRRLRYTAAQIADRFKDVDIKDLGLDETDVDTRKDVVFCLYYRDDVDRETTAVLAPDKRPVGYKYLLKSGDGCKTLEEGGYYRMPAMVVRWSKTAGSVWGNSPAMTALATIRMLNETEAQVWEARAKSIDPPNKTTEFGIVGDLDLVPGGLTVVSDMNELQPIINGTNWVEAENGVQRLENSVRETFFVDRLELKESPAMTATEVYARQERMLRMMAPVLGRLQNDMLNPLVENLFNLMLRAGQFLAPPEGLVETELDIEYTGPIPRAQKAEQAQGMEQWMGSVVGLAEAFPEALDIPDVDYVLRTLALLRGAPAESMRQQQEVDEIREAKAQQAAEMQEAQLAQEQGAAAQSMGQGAQALQAVGGGQVE